MTDPRVAITELCEEDLPFLLELWHIPAVMRYADELPGLRGWSKETKAREAWGLYQEQRAAHGPGYTQLIIRLADGTPVGESFFAPVPDGFTLDRWVKPAGVLCLIGDIKLRPEYWGQGLGTEGMKRIVAWLFTHSGCALLVVPPHSKNPAAAVVYQKAGFTHYEDRQSWRGHTIMELWRQGYEAAYGL
jgi:RimJ/RimL family protein N-acetyltransferase